MKERPFNIAICDDEDTARRQIKEMTAEICQTAKIRAEISCYETAKALLSDLQQGIELDLLLLDVMMPEQDGMELARMLRRNAWETEIIFISSNREMALQGYEVNAARYLAKPLDPKRLEEAIRFCCEKLRTEKDILLPADGSMRRISPKEILYIEIAGRKSRICQERAEWDTSLSMTELEKLLSDSGFVRCHQSFLVNLSYVKNFRTSSLELTDGKNIPVSKHRVKEVRQAFFSYMAQ